MKKTLKNFIIKTVLTFIVLLVSWIPIMNVFNGDVFLTSFIVFIIFASANYIVSTQLGEKL